MTATAGPVVNGGVRDAATVLLLSTSGVDTSIALSISVLLGVGYAAVQPFLRLFGGFGLALKTFKIFANVPILSSANEQTRELQDYLKSLF